MKTPSFFLILLAAVFFQSCTTTQTKHDESTPVTTPSQVPSGAVVSQTPQDEVENVDVDGLKRHLSMDRRFNQLGFVEKAFNTCQVGYGYSAVNRCRQMHMVVLNYRLQCRDSEGTVNQMVTASQLRPISLRDVKWSMKGVGGQSRTDSEGYGSITTLSSGSQKNQRLKLTVRDDFLIMKASEMTQMITPKNWCE